MIRKISREIKDIVNNLIKEKKTKKHLQMSKKMYISLIVCSERLRYIEDVIDYKK